MKILVEKKGFEEGMIYHLERKTTIGRESTNSVQILDPKVSRNHAEITLKEDGSYVIKDLESANGTYLNGSPVPPVTEKVLRLGDEIMLGSTVFRFEESGQGEEEQMSIKITSEGTERPTTMDLSSEKRELSQQECSHITNPSWNYCPLCGKRLK